MLKFFRRTVTLGLLAAVLAWSPALAQTQIRIPTTSPTLPPGTTIGGGIAPMTPNGSAPVLGTPSFDPYATSNPASLPPSFPPPTAPGSVYGSPLPQTPGAYGAPAPYTPAPYTPPSYTPAPYNSAAPTPGAPGTAFPSTGYPATYPSQPSVLFPNGVGPGWDPGLQWPQPQEGPYLRLFQNIWLTYTWVAGGDGPTNMSTNDAELGTTMNFPNFLWSKHPLQVSPIFIMSWWDGPTTNTVPPNTFPTELPARVYSAILDFRWQPQITPQISADLDFNIGIFDDFEGVSTDSIRLQGTGLGVIALTPTMTAKLGVTYLDRVDLKLLPAFGILWTPNPQTRWDLYFPRPKLASYLTTVGNTDVWCYINAEYGGGSWAISRANVGNPQMDINDIRVGLGLEWTSQSGVHGFTEAAYVFNRELVFASGPVAVQELDSTFMLRGGLTY